MALSRAIGLSEPDLTVKERRFITEYVKSGNGAAAIRAAGYDVTTNNSAAVMASTYLKKPKIERAIAASLRKSEVTSQWVLQELRSMAETNESPVVRLKSLELLGKHLKMWPVPPCATIGTTGTE